MVKFTSFFYSKLDQTLLLSHSIVFEAYRKLSGSDIEDSIEGETTGNLENLLLAVGKTWDKS